MRRIKRKRQKFFPTNVFQKNFWINIGKACMITWLTLFFWCGLSIVEYQAAINCYVKEDSLFSIDRKEPLSIQINLLGDMYRLDLDFFNQAVGISQKYFPLIPAPLRLGKQLYLSAQEAYKEHQTQKRLQEFIENI